MRLRICLSWAVFSASWWLVSAGNAAEWQFDLTVSAGSHDRKNVPVRATIDVPTSLADRTRAELTDTAGNVLEAQLTRPGLLTAHAADMRPGENRETVWRELHFVIDKLSADQSLTLKGGVAEHDSASAGGSGPSGFRWQDTPGESALLTLDGKPALQYMYTALDESTAQSREQTYKVYHHLYDPSGTQLVTKGPGGLYTHHRGLFYGFNRITYGDGKKIDTWHCKGDAHLSHEGFVSTEAGAVLGRHKIAVDWHGIDKEVFAREQREMTVYNLPGGRLVEFASKLTGTIGPVTLDGDPQHAGFQFRASNEVAERTKSQTYYLRPDGRGSPGETRNWPQAEHHVNLPFNAMSFVLGDQRYTAAYLDRPENPKPARHSERDYGRFGSYFVHELGDDRPLMLNYRVWLQKGEMTGEQAASLSSNFVEPPRAVVR